MTPVMASVYVHLRCTASHLCCISKHDLAKSHSQVTLVVQAGAEEATVKVPPGSSPASVLSSIHPR